MIFVRLALILIIACVALIPVWILTMRARRWVAKVMTDEVKARLELEEFDRLAKQAGGLVKQIELLLASKPGVQVGSEEQVKKIADLASGVEAAKQARKAIDGVGKH